MQLPSAQPKHHLHTHSLCRTAIRRQTLCWRAASTAAHCHKHTCTHIMCKITTTQPVPDCDSPPDAVLEGGVDLFCGLECERSYYIKSSSGERKAVFCAERSACGSTST